MFKKLFNKDSKSKKKKESESIPSYIEYQSHNNLEDIPLNLSQEELDQYILELYGRGELYKIIYIKYIKLCSSIDYKAWFFFHIMNNSIFITNQSSEFQMKIVLNQEAKDFVTFTNKQEFNSILSFIKDNENYRTDLMDILNNNYNKFKYTSYSYIYSRINNDSESKEGVIKIDMNMPLCSDLFINIHKQLLKVDKLSLSYLCKQIDENLFSKYLEENKQENTDRKLSLLFQNKLLIKEVATVILSLLVTDNLKFIVYYILNSRNIEFIQKITLQLCIPQTKALLYTFNPDYSEIAIGNLLSICIRRKAIEQNGLYNLLCTVIEYEKQIMDSEIKANIAATMGIELWRAYKDKMDVQSYISCLWSTKDVVLVEKFRDLIEPHKDLRNAIDKVITKLFKPHYEKTLMAIKQRGHLFSLISEDTVKMIQDDPEVNTDIENLNSFSNQLLLSFNFNPSNHQKKLISQMGISSDKLLEF